MDFSELNLVYSTDGGKVEKTKPKQTAPESDGIVRLHRETKGRKGKGVTFGTVKDFVIEIQTDQREIIKTVLEKQGYQVKLAGG